MYSLPGKRTTRGQGLVEYALVIALVGLLTILGITLFGEKNHDIYNRIISSISGTQTANTEVEGEKNRFTLTTCEGEVSNIKNWKINTDGKKDWESNGSAMCIANNRSSQNFGYSKCSQNKAIPSDYEVELVNAHLTQGDGINLMFRVNKYSQKPDGYAFTYDAASNAFLLVKWVKGNRTTIASTPAGKYDRLVPHTVKVQVEGTTIKAFVDGNLVLTAQDSTYASGGTGIHVAGDDTRACFDDLVIRTSGE
ncbi:MAG: hypothetical protein HPY85_11900 [Anaerolineae bacterium]|nr:hypothetical protein [Anaerolineae bacterium]